MSYRIELSPPVKTELKALPAHVRAQALDQIQALGQEPRPDRARGLRDQPGIYRVWPAGRWRIAYQVDDEERRVRLLRVRRKEQIDYDSLAEPEPPSNR